VLKLGFIFEELLEERSAYKAACTNDKDGWCHVEVEISVFVN